MGKCTRGLAALVFFFLSVSSTLSLVVAGETIVWSANFETGNNSQFNGPQASTCNSGIVGVSTTIIHSGHYAGYYYGKGAGSGVCREYPSEFISNSQPLTDFYWNMWVYVPSVKLTDWVSFATFAPGNRSTSLLSLVPFTIDSSTGRELHLYVDVLPLGQRIILQNLVRKAVQWPLNAWFQISVTAHGLGTPNADIIVNQNGIPIIHYHGKLLNGPLTIVHFGLYMGGGQSAFSVLNDDIIIESIPA